MATLPAAAITGLKAQIDTATQDPNGIPGVQYFAVNKNGEYIFEHCAGKIGLGKDTDMAENHVLWMASCTKLVTGIACMQLVEQGRIGLDDVGGVEKVCPELKDVKVLQEDGSLVDKKRGITLRMLLTHTAGFSYSFFSHKLAAHYEPIGLYELSGRSEDYTSQPLVNQPGEKYAYGISIDWAGILVMRITGLSLEDYFRQHITGPLGIADDMSFLPGPAMRKDLACFHYRDPAGKIDLRADGHMLREPLVCTPSEGGKIFQSGGAGTFARPKAYCQIIATLLNDGVHAPSGNRILTKETVDLMFTNQLPDMPDFARTPSEVSKPEYANASDEMYPEPGNPAQGWGLSFFLHVEDSIIHSKGTGWWAGLPNLFWWCDRSKGVGGIIGTQIVPFGDLKVVTLWAMVEGGIYGNLVQAE